MGRMNNKRTQAAAEANKHTPSRARFSKGPPGGRGRGGGKPKGKASNGTSTNGTGTSKNTGNNSSSSSQTQQGRGRQPNQATASRVIDKIQKRAQGPRVATTQQALQNVDKSKFDELTLSEEIVRVITNLLTDLGVMDSSGKNSKEVKNVETATISTVSQPEGGDGDFDDDDDDLSFDDIVNHWQEEQDEYEEQDEEDENDGEDDYLDFLNRAAGGDLDDDWEDDVMEEETKPSHVVEKTTDDANDDKDKPDTFDDVRENPAFVHLTTILSFDEVHAARACRAIEDWDIPEPDNPNSNTSDKLSLAMDWICLHLTEVELTIGFKINKRKEKQPLVSKIGIPLVASGLTKAIPHPSISVAKSITSDKEWSRSVRQQERVVGFLRLGFHHSEATQACEDANPTNNQESKGPEQDVALLRLLQILEQHAVEGFVSGNKSDALNKTDLTYAAEERQQEREALKAIYDDKFKIGSSLGVERYSISFTPAKNLHEPARSEDCKLLVFIRPGYPVAEPPLFLFTNSSLAPTLLRRINDAAARKARESLGALIVFEIVTFLAENLRETQMDFIKEQRFKEMEAQQRHLRLEAGHKVDDKDDEPLVDDGTLSRRQRSKVIAAGKSYVRPEDIQKQKEEQKRHAEKRLEKIKHEESNIRTTRAERTIAKRQEEQIQEEAKQASRSAMNAAFVRGESVEEAREAAEEARKQSLRDNGVEVPEAKPKVHRKKQEGQVEVTGNGGRIDVSSSTHRATTKTAAGMDRLEASAEPSQQNDVSKATPTTAVFMDKLRQMYEDAAKTKSAKVTTSTTQERNELEVYHLDQPKQVVPSDDADKLQTRRVPRPVAAPTKELTDVMNDVITQQKQQPWLVFPEARAPTVAGERGTVTPEHERRQKEIGKKLRQELDRKRQAATDWASKNPNSDYRPSSKKKGFKGFSPQHFNFMMTARQRYVTVNSCLTNLYRSLSQSLSSCPIFCGFCRLPAYKMEHEIVKTIAANQITVIAGDTGCGKVRTVSKSQCRYYFDLFSRFLLFCDQDYASSSAYPRQLDSSEPRCCSQYHNHATQTNQCYRSF
jgi:hypothetical protein